MSNTTFQLRQTGRDVKHYRAEASTATVFSNEWRSWQITNMGQVWRLRCEKLDMTGIRIQNHKDQSVPSSSTSFDLRTRAL